jgi:hypothetical protein
MREAAVSREFDCTCFALNVSGTYAKSANLKLFFVFLIHAIVAGAILEPANLA